MTTCITCKSEIAEGVTKHFADLGDYSGVIENVPCRICKQCGEVIYSISVAKRLEQIVNELENSIGQKVIVLPYSDQTSIVA